MTRLRPATLPADYIPMATLLSTSRTPPMTPAALADAQSWWPEGTIAQRIMAEDEAGRVVGYAEAHRFPNTAEGKFYGTVVVQPANRHNGTGTMLLAAIEQFAAGHGGNRIVGDVADTDSASLAFMHKRGYEVERHGCDSTLDLNGLKEPPLAGAVEAAVRSGIHFFTLADADSPAIRQALYELYSRTMVDIPGYEARSFMTYETWRQAAIEAKGARPDWVVIAADQDRLVGVTQALQMLDHVYTNHTLVDRAYRGRGIAQALKVLTIRAAIDAGVPTMRTGNDSLNGPMLAVNRKLGYKPLAGEYTVVRHL